MLRPVTAAPSIRSIPRVLAQQPSRPWRCDNGFLFPGLLSAGAHPSCAASRRLLSTVRPRAADPTKPASAPRLSPKFFSPHRFESRGKHVHASASQTPTTAAAAAAATSSVSFTSAQAPGKDALLPHRRRQIARREAAAAAAAADPAIDPENPPDASSVLSAHAASQPAHSFSRAFSAYLSLAKPRLTILVVLTAMVPYALYPVPAFLSPALAIEAPSLSPLTLLYLTVGTTLCSASANSLNMIYEPSTDARMSRTRNRPLVRGLVSRRGAIVFALVTAALGISSLYYGVNPTTSFLGASNIALYAGLYTPLKAVSAANTWVGALVGGIPPLMGWAAAAGESATTSSPWELLFAPDGSSLGGWLFASLLFAWQFPHFMALSWSVRDEYKAAGLRMLCWTNPRRNARVALRYSLAFFPICLGLCLTDVTSWSFAVTSLPVNVWLAREALRFWRHEGHKGSARGLFWASVWHLPVVLALAVLQKKGMWERVWRSVVGEEEWDEEDELEEFALVEGGVEEE